MYRPSLGNYVCSQIISKVKKSEYIIDKNITGWNLFEIVTKRFFMLVRGIRLKPFLAHSNGALFIDQNVKIQYKNKVYIGSGCTISEGCRINALSEQGIHLGNNFSLGANSFIECTGVISQLGLGIDIGDNVGIASNSFLGVRGYVKIGNNTIIGPFFSLHAENHKYEALDTLIRLQGTTRRGIIIGDNCWIGAKVTILDGVTIGNGCVIAAGAVVNRCFPDNSVIGGIPAKLIKYREDLS